MNGSAFKIVAMAMMAQSTTAWSQVVDLKTQPAASAGSMPTATAPAKKPMTTCEALASDWRSVEIALARSDVEELSDNSAPRATMRAIRDSNQIELASMTLALMRDNKCPLPKRAPSSVTFMLPALDCRTEQMKGNLKAAQCETSNWKPLGQ